MRKFLTYFDKVQLEAIVGPRREQHGTVLFVERKIPDVDGAGAAKDDHRQPRDVPVWRHDDVRTDGRLVSRHVGAGKLKDQLSRSCFYEDATPNI